MPYDAPTGAFVPEKRTYRDLAAQNPNLSETDILNSANPSKAPSESDVTVIGAGVHGLVYAIHTRMQDPSKPVKISLFEKTHKPLYKIGESTLPLYSQWLKMFGFTGDYMLRIFGLKDGLEFYILDGKDQELYTDFNTNGPPGIFLPGFQIERQINELFLTLFAQRCGIDVWHGHQADLKNTVLSGDGNSVALKEVATGKKFTANSPLVVDGTGRFRQVSSKFSRVKRFEGWNTDAYWAYFECHNEADIPKVLRFYEAGHTNHLCFPEGWIWVIRLPSWEGSEIPNLMDMLNYLMDHAQEGTPNDELPSTYELAEMFGCKVRWVYSIGYAVRNDVKYGDITALGKTEAQRIFKFYENKYKKIRDFMSHFTLLDDLYGPNTTWFVRKQLSYYTEQVSGPGWITIGDGVGFTNPLQSPGITAALAYSTYAAELTRDSLSKKTEAERREIWKPYDKWCAEGMVSLHEMNKFNYIGFKNIHLAPQVSLMWQFFSGIGIPGWQLIRAGYKLTYDNWLDYCKGWMWGAQVPEYVTVCKKAIELMDTPVDHIHSEEEVNALIAFSDKVKREAVASDRFNFRWDGLLRYFDILMNYDTEKNVLKDSFANQCKACGTWHVLHAGWRKCYTCGVIRPAEDCEIIWRPKLDFKEVSQLVRISDLKALGTAAEVVDKEEDAKITTAQEIANHFDSVGFSPED